MFAAKGPQSVNVTGRLKQAYIASRVAHDHPQAESKFVNVEGANLHFVIKGDDGVSLLSKLPAWPVIGDVVNFLFTPLVSAWLVRTDLEKAFAPDAVPKNYLRHTIAEWTVPKKVKWYSVDDALLNESLPKLSPRYSELTVPTAIVTGDSDLIVPAQENAHRLSKTLSNSHLTVLPNTGHP